MSLEYFPCYHSYLEKTAKLSDSELGRLFRALMTYSATGELQQLEGREALAYDFIVYDIDRANERHSGISQKRSEAGKSGRAKQLGKLGKAGQNGQLPNLPSKTGNNNNNNNNKDNNNNKASIDAIENANAFSCAEPLCDSAPPVAKIPLNDGTMFEISQDDVDKWQELYPAVDIMQELRNMTGWCDSNPSKRKTKRGIRAFITRWLQKTQDKGGNNGYTGGRNASNPKRSGGYNQQNSEYEWLDEYGVV